MPDREKVIKAIEICYIAGNNCTECPLFYKDECNDELMHEVLTLLREQEPVKPKRALGVLPDWYHCGVCGADMLDTGDGYRPKYCPQCGRAVKWDD